MDIWRRRLGIADTAHLSFLYNTCVVPKTPIACPELEHCSHSDRMKRILAYYITIHRADGYDETQWCILHMVCKVFNDDADIFWAFTMICGYQRPYRPIHGEKGFQQVVKRVMNHVKVELCILDVDLCTCVETSLQNMLSSVVARWFSTWFAIIGAGPHFYTATLACPSKMRTKWLSLVAAQLLYQAAGDTPRIYAHRNKIFSAFFSTRITDDKALIRAAKKRL